MKGCTDSRQTATRGLVTIGSALVVLFVSSARAEWELESGLDSTDTIEQLVVRLTVSADGDDVVEPVALDLGLGFPLWLHPLGRADEDQAIFGAVPNRSDASRVASAGSTVEFTFEPAAESGQDELQSTSQLLASVRVSDIGRIGFISLGESDWILGGYEIQINGIRFAANDDVGASVAERREQARTRMLELTPTIEPLQTEVADLNNLIEAELAFEEDRARRDEIHDQLVPLLREQTRLERLLAGSYPWFEEQGFEPEWRSAEPIAAGAVTVVTSMHTGADTKNHVYFRAGGHRYLLSSPLNPLSADAGPQRFPLDLISGPLVASDLRGYAFGMLGSNQPYGDAPDRWHPQRLVVEIDGRTVFDSEEQEVDRLSLEAIRVIPPAHFDAGGAVRSNTPTARETFVWEAGQALGLDLIGGGAAELPPADVPSFPEAEPGLVSDEPETEAWDDFFDDTDSLVDDSSGDPYAGFDPECEGFPGEAYPDESMDPWPSEDALDDAAWTDEFATEDFGSDGFGFDGYDPGTDEWLPGSSWLDLLTEVLDAVERLTGEDILPDFEPIPEGDPLQIHNVHFAGNAPGPVDIEWDVHGDESNVDYYDVQVVMLLPHRESHIVGTVWQDIAFTGSRQHPVALEEAWTNAMAAAVAMSDADRALAYFAPVVTPHLIEPAGPGDGGGMGPARPALPAGPLQAVPPIAAQAIFTAADGTISSVPIENSLPIAPGRSVWLEPGALESHAGIVFENVHPGIHVVVRGESGIDAKARVAVAIPVPAGAVNLRVVAHVGFTGMSEVADSTSVRMTHATLSSTGIGPAPVIAETTTDVIIPSGPLGQLEATLVKPPDHDLLIVSFEFEGGTVSEESAPALFGLRLHRL